MNARLALLALVLTQLASSAAADNFSWNFQRTGFRTTASHMPQTALSMRGNLSWPVVYGIDEGMLNAYSLFPVPNPGPVPFGPPTNWHRIGTNLTKGLVPTSGFYLQAASGAPDSFGVSIQTQSTTSQPLDFTIWGTSTTGFQPPQSNTQALKFDADGDPFVGTTSMITPPGPRAEKMYDVALSNNGDVAAVTQLSPSGPFTFWQRSALLGGNWLSTSFTTQPQDATLFGPSIDLNYDSSGGPHIVGVNRISTANNITAYRFDVMSGGWQSSVLDVAAFSSPPIADVAAAANDAGVVGAAWVNNGVLKYAFLDTNEPNANWITTTVASLTSLGTPLELSQGVGLAYDKAGLPVISFVERSNRQIWIAYDPPVALAPHPGPADFNGDGFVDGGDLQDWTEGFGDSPAADADGDGDSDGRDLLAWQRSITSPPNPAAATAIPEPAACSFILMAATVVIGVSRRQGSQLT